LVIHGPNLNMTGIREQQVYGLASLKHINDAIAALGDELGLEVRFYQSNCEGEIIDRIHSAHGNYQGVILNAGAYTHYSYAIRDAIKCISVPVIEVHLSNTAAREEFRHTSVIGPVCVGTIAGFGEQSYLLALRYFAEQLGK